MNISNNEFVALPHTHQFDSVHIIDSPHTHTTTNKECLITVEILSAAMKVRLFPRIENNVTRYVWYNYIMILHYTSSSINNITYTGNGADNVDS